jgi:FlaA1/EpsC-like NDP-sugar epimerase
MYKDIFEDKEILITGGTGTLGKTITKIFLKKHKPKGIRIFSRDEHKHVIMKQDIERDFGKDIPIGFYVGDVADYDRVDMVTRGVDYIYHTAAMKQVPICETNPLEAVRVNIQGARNIIRASVKNQVKIVMNISTDKAVYPVNFYGITKAVAEKLFIHANVYSAFRFPRFSCCRYGNVINSRGSVIPMFQRQYDEDGTLKLTHKEMTRFWIKIEDVANFIIECSLKTLGGDIFVPKMKTMKLVDLANALYPRAKKKFIGIRKGEKLHECLVSLEESRHVWQDRNCFRINPAMWGKDEFIYTSEDISNVMTNAEIQEIIREYYG